jgi:hypothetical protein
MRRDDSVSVCGALAGRGSLRRAATMSDRFPGTTPRAAENRKIADGVGQM